MAPPDLIDTHTHLLAGELGRGPDAYWNEARRAGVSQAVIAGTTAADSEAAADFVSCRAGLFATAGIHPGETAAAAAEDLGRVRALLRLPKVVAVGESGLDRFHGRVPLDVQERWLLAHAGLALEADLPLVLHLREALEDARRLLAPFAARGLRAVVHCFAGGPEDLQPFVDWGFAISFSGILTYPRAHAVRAAAAAAPRELVLLETDAPWLPPEPVRGRTNAPAFLVHTARTLARVWGTTLEGTAATTSANARGFFRLPRPE